MKALDTETYLFVPGLVAPKMIAGQVADATSAKLRTPPEVKGFLIGMLDAREPIGFAHAPFDLCVACAMFPELVPVVFEVLERGLIRDTHVRQALLDLGRGTLLEGANGEPLDRYHLQSIAAKVLGIFVAKENTPRLTYAHRDGVPFDLWTEDERAYALKDARVTYDVIVRQNEGDDPGTENLALELRENRAAFALQLMSSWGPRTDPAMVADVTKQITEAHEATIKRFTAAGIYRGEGWCRDYKKDANPGTPHECRERCRPWPSKQIGTKDTKHLKTLVSRAYQGQPPLTEKEGISTDRDTLLESGDDLLMALGEAGKNEKEYSTYLDVIARGTKTPICVEYDLIKRTTRTSSRKPNLQNLPRGGRTRECFIPRPGTVWCSVDMPSLELVTLAQNLLWMFGESALAETLRSGKDPHVLLASALEGVSYESALARKKAKDPRMVLLRQAAKPVNYGMGGGMGAEKLTIYARQPSNGGVRFCLVAGAEKCGVETYMSENFGKPLCRACVVEAKRFRDAWFASFPEMRAYFARVGEETEVPDEALIDVRGPEGEPVLWILGRKFSEAANLRFQGLAARMMKDALWRVGKACYVDPGALLGCRPVLFVHDEIIVEMPETVASEAAWAQAHQMNAAAKYWCPDVPCIAEPALMRRWFKGAEATKSKDGRLKPWWPEKWTWPADKERMEMDRAA